jgi:transposase-like protein
MAVLQIKKTEGMYTGWIGEYYFEFPANDENRKVLILLLRSFKKSEGGKHGLFSQEQVAAAIPDFVGKTKQSIQDHERRFAESGGSLLKYLNRQRKVDESVVCAIRAALHQDVLAGKESLAEEVNKQLGRNDISASNIEAGFEQIPFSEVRPCLKRQIESGRVSYKESFLLKELMQRASTALGKRAGIKSEDLSKGMQLSDPTAIRKLLTPNIPIGEVSQNLCVLVFVMTLWRWGVPLSVLGRWCGVHATTILRNIGGLTLALWPVIEVWIHKHVRASKAYLDEKWIKIRGVWYYWYVVLDVESDVPIFHALLASRSEAAVDYVVSQLRALNRLPRLIITDGLAAYHTVFSKLDEIVHILCRFHHQQGVTRWLKQHFSKKEDVTERKKAMKKVFQTTDKRTVKRRFARLKERAAAWGIEAWITLTEKKLPHLLPSVGSCRIPSTTNGIERFFRTYTRFAKVRSGFHSVVSTKRALTVFLICYLFTQGQNGRAPIEAVVPDAPQMPLYRLINDPFNCLKIFEEYDAEDVPKVKPIENIADLMGEVAYAA